MLKPEEQRQLDDIQQKYYMKPIIQTMSSYIEKHGNIGALDYLHEILTLSKDKVDLLLNQRKRDGEIKDISQARKSVVGAAFSNSIIYLFLKAKGDGDIKKAIYITDKTKQKVFEDMVTIHVDGETQKPDMDLALYSLDDSGVISSCIIISLKTSLRERAGQTYKWKLLLEIATSDNHIKDKYKITYKANKMPLVCFATVNFYNEINNPQHRGMFKFFDSSFIGKPIKPDFIQNMSRLVKYAEDNLK